MSFLQGRAARVVTLAILAAGLILLANGLFIPAKALVAQILLERAWNASKQGAAMKPWPWADTRPVARIEVPRLGQRAIVLAGGSGQAMAFGPTHMPNTPLPGQGGTSVIAGHRDTHLAFLRDVRPGDTIIVTLAGGQVLRFVAGESRIVHARGSTIDPDRGGGRLALVTCWPFEARLRGPLRYVLFARPEAVGTTR